MNADDLLDAFGQIDDRFIVPEKQSRVISWRRRASALAAAVLAAVMCIGTAMAVSDGFRDFVFSIFQIDTHDVPPVPEESQPTEPGLHEIEIVNIDGDVNAYYFSSGGSLAVCNGGFFTSEWHEAGTAPSNPAFWEITAEGAVQVPGTRVDFPLTYGEKTFRICFDYAVLDGKLAIQVWPEGLDSDPVGNGWNALPLGIRTDAALLTIPVLSGNAHSHDLLLLDLNSLEAIPLISAPPILADAYWITEDLCSAIIAGSDPESHESGYWLYDLRSKAVARLGTNVSFAWFLDDRTVAFREDQTDGQFNLVRFHIPTGIRDVILENVSSNTYRPIQNHWAEGSHGLLRREDGSVNLVDFHTREQWALTGLDPENLTCDESPDGSRIMLGYAGNNGYTRIGILDPETGVLKLLHREVSGGTESFRGWLDNDTLVITAHDVPGAAQSFTPGDGYYVYVYRFLEETEKPTSPTFTEPADEAFVRVKDYCPDIVIDLRYASVNNFTGQQIYNFSDAWLRYGTVKKLMAVQEDLRTCGLRLKIWDGFRPAAAQFRLWEVCPDPTYVSNPNQGFSSHSRGGTVDVTLVYSDGTELPMPTGFDDFSKLADQDYSDCPPETAANAMFLEATMKSHGFKPYSAEWWHFTDLDPYPVEESFLPK